MADKPRDWGGLNVNFQNLPPKAGDPPLLGWLRWMAIGMVAVIALRLLAWLLA